MAENIAQKGKAQILQSGANITAAAQSASIDLSDIAHKGIRVKLDSITALDAANDLLVKLQHSDDNSVWSDVAYEDSKLLSELAAGEEHAFDYEGVKKYIRLDYSVAAGSPDVVVSSYGLLVPHALPA